MLLVAHLDIVVHQVAGLQPPPIAAAVKAIAAGTADAATVSRISALPVFNAMLLTIYVATRLASDGAFNALLVTARATLQCRMLPGDTPEETLSHAAPGDWRQSGQDSRRAMIVG